MTTFRDMKIGEQIIAALDENGFEEAFPIQQAAIPVLLTGRDVIGQAHTGTGKTAAYSISMLEKLQPGSGIQGLVIAPTRELAVQISVEIEKFAKYTKLRVATIYGGQSMGPQLDAINCSRRCCDNVSFYGQVRDYKSSNAIYQIPDAIHPGCNFSSIDIEYAAVLPVPVCRLSYHVPSSK